MESGEDRVSEVSMVQHAETLAILCQYCKIGPHLQSQKHTRASE